MKQDKTKMWVVQQNDPRYPSKLLPYTAMPERLYVLGKLPDAKKKSVAIVGARGCSAYGKQEALRFGRALAEQDVQIISGMAIGIDAWAHRGALEAGGATFAVLGCGVDICYPVSHQNLYEQIQIEGGVLSEWDPGTPPLAYHFPIRNRIISALADLVLVIEARKKSGSLITVSYALEQGKSVYAVPGRNRDALSEGCNALLADGAGLATEPEDLLRELGLAPTTERKKKKKQKLPTSWQKDKSALRTYHSLSSDEKSLAQLQEETELSLPDLTGALVRLCLGGYAEELPGHHYIRS